MSAVSAPDARSAQSASRAAIEEAQHRTHARVEAAKRELAAAPDSGSATPGDRGAHVDTTA